MSSSRNIEVRDDSLAAPEVGAWAEEKHRYVSLYSALFSSGMRRKWPKRTYIELYAGAGYSKIRDTSKLILGSPLRALTLEVPFNKYVFCEENREKLAALKTRAKQICPNADIAFVEGDCNRKTQEILAAIPRKSGLSLCFADPFDISLHFTTIRTLATAGRIDFLILLALGMDANRNYDHYLKDESHKIDNFLGSDSWRQRWAKAQWDAVKFTRFLADEFTTSMAALDYIPPPRYMMKEVKLPQKNVPLYRLALFSRNQLAYKYWEQVLKYGTDQREFEGW